MKRSPGGGKGRKHLGWRESGRWTWADSLRSLDATGLIWGVHANAGAAG